MIDYQRIFNFSAGPSVLPVSVLEKARDQMLNFENSGMSVMEMSHRSAVYESILNQAKSRLIRLLDIPDTHDVLFLQGGASHQFVMIPMNLALPNQPIDMIHTGIWTEKAIAELQKISPYRLAGTGEPSLFRSLPNVTLSPDASYVHLVSNNTIFGTQWNTFPETGAVPLVADMSSDILSRTIDVSKFGLIFAGAQKNMGPAGVTVVIIRKELMNRCPDTVPTIFQYRTHSKANSLYNTPPGYAIYVLGLMLEWAESMGGVSAIEKANHEKASRLYNTIDRLSPFYTCPADTNARSKMNVVFWIQNGNKPLEAKFIEEAKQAGLVELSGHRLAGGLRASLYNAQPLEAVDTLVAFMETFKKNNA